ncbi:putative RNA-binding Zn ribbon-like protein [Kribbella steppae]|uniref:Putative RNA-binding Zn ribbon-like protein n=1 Tax=Kribbella steppae TaxID=2512223 RepID=A0A4R2HQN3_9ACTN|nr:CGNR zinc finger domain-containing protein [Kribbella steppae]TCO33504.1 putative RNA-binding Zn ribbon-like protein [Kribbella steppae]
METVQLPDGIRDLPVVAGDLALDFANTVDDPLGPARHDHIADYHALLSWSLRLSLLTEPEANRLLHTAAPRRAAAVVRRAHSLREAINLTAGAVADTHRASTSPRPAGSLEGWEQLRPFVLAAVDQADLVELKPTWRFELIDSPLWPVAHAAYELLTGPRAGRIKRCAGCPWLFVDQSKNGSRRWCSMEFCGTSEKVRLYVSRRAARRARS